MTHYDIWLSKDCEHLIVTPVDKGYEVIDEVLSVIVKEGYLTSDILRDSDGGFRFPLKLRKAP